MKTLLLLTMAWLGCCSLCVAQQQRTVWLDELDLRQMEQDWGSPQKKLSVEKHPLTIGEKVFERGVGTHAQSTLHLQLDGQTTRFTAKAGVDADSLDNRASVIFSVVGDGKSLFKSPLMKRDTPCIDVDVDLTGVQSLELTVEDGGDGISFDHADWVDASFTFNGAAPKASPVIVGPTEPYILTPKPPAAPRITGPKVFGVRPGNPVLFRFTATGEKPITFSVDPLPPGVTLDASTGQLSGTIAEKGEHTLHVKATNATGSQQRDFKLVVGERIALTPPLGWNSWNCFAGAVSDEKVRAAADAMVSSGLIDHGWTYINIDDCWQIKPGSKDPVLAGDNRDKDGLINTNKRFPDMLALTGYIHSKGLKAGLYSSPGPLTCAGFVGSYEFEAQDAKQWTDWEFDYVKYDWCSYGKIAPKPDLAAMKKPYAVMRDALAKQKRDIVYSLCQYGKGDVWEWGDEVGGNCWRTTGDITDTWRSMSGIGFSQDGHEQFAKPGCWNDPDMLVVGKVGWGPRVRPTRLSPDEQYTHISLWCLLSSPLLIGCDMTQLDDFTLSLLTNDEVLAINQDVLGKPAARISKSGEPEIWARDLEDGSKAVGLFNRSRQPQEISIDLVTLGLKTRQVVRDLWRQKDLGTFDSSFKATVPAHGVVLIRLNRVD